MRSPPPNVLLFTVCSVRPDHMSCYGYERQTTPNLDRFVQDAILFEKATTAWPKTAPALAAILTGQYGHTTRVMRITPRRSLSTDHDLIFEHFKQRGYATAGFSTSAALNASTGTQQGLDTFEELYRNRQDKMKTSQQMVIGWLAQCSKNQPVPFFLWAHYNNAHTPYTAPGTKRDRFVGDAYYKAGPRIPVNENDQLALDVPEDHPFRKQILRADVGGVHPHDALEEHPDDLAFYVARYDAGIYAVDRMIGQVINALRKFNLLDNTIIAVIGDHGESLTEHNYYCGHGRFPYEPSARIPFLLRPVGGGDPLRFEQRVSSLALAPTLLELANIPIPEAFEAESLVAAIRGDQRAPPHVFLESGYQMDFQITVYEGPWKLIHVPNPIDRQLMTGSEWELYNLDVDPGELTNLIGTEADVATRLRAVLESWSSPWVARAYNDAGTESETLDEETKQQLEALGYIP